MGTVQSLSFKSMQGRVSPEEWRVRVDLAALYRLVAHFGWTDLVATHLSARVPGPEHHFLINPYGLLFEEITASSLVKIGVDGKKVEESPYEVNDAGFTIHSAIHMAREDALFVLHAHTVAGVGVSSQEHGLLPLNQTALIVHKGVAYHDYEGVANDHDERPRLVAHLGAKHLMILRNHGTLAVGETAAAAFLNLYYLERACAIQIAALAGGAKQILPSDEAQAKFSGRIDPDKADALAWPALQRLVQRKDPSYAT